MISIIGGLLLILGAYFVFQGEVFKSVFVYFIADICWCLLAYDKGDYLGLVFITIGMLLGLGAYLKMNYGQMRKTLKL